MFLIKKYVLEFRVTSRHRALRVANKSSKFEHLYAKGAFIQDVRPTPREVRKILTKPDVKGGGRVVIFIENHMRIVVITWCVRVCFMCLTAFSCVCGDVILIQNEIKKSDVHRGRRVVNFRTTPDRRGRGGPNITILAGRPM